MVAVKEVITLKHVKGDIFESNADVILHQVNCQGVMGSGVAKQVREKYPSVYLAYKNLCDERGAEGVFGLAHFCPIDGEKERFIVNMFAQYNFGYDGKCYTDYEKLKWCLAIVNQQCAGKSIAVPYLMGCHRGGGDWDVVSKMIEETLVDCDVTLYEYCGG